MTAPGELTAENTVVVVGASLAGWRAVETLRTEGFEGNITLVGEERHLPYDRPPLSKQVLAGAWPPEKAVLADKRRSSEHRVHEVLGRRAVRLDVAGRRVELDDDEVLDGDAIVVTTGAAPRKLPGTESLSQRDGLFTLRTLDDSLALRAALTAIEAPRVVVIGSGFIGAEVASTSAGLGCRVTVLEALDVPLRNVLGPMVGAYCGSLHGAHGVELRTGVAVLGVSKASASDDAGVIGGGKLLVELGGGEALPADVVVVGIGVVPSTDWLAGSGLTVDNGVVCDDRLFAADGIVAAGDVARWNWRHDGREESIRIEHWQVAAEAGVAAARSLLAGHADAPSFTPIPYFWSDQYGIRFQVLGNPRGDDDVEIADGSLSEGKFVVLFGRAGRLRAVMAIGRPRQLMSFRPLLEAGSSWNDALGSPLGVVISDSTRPRMRRATAVQTRLEKNCYFVALGVVQNHGTRTARAWQLGGRPACSLGERNCCAPLRRSPVQWRRRRPLSSTCRSSVPRRDRDHDAAPRATTSVATHPPEAELPAVGRRLRIPRRSVTRPDHGLGVQSDRR